MDVKNTFLNGDLQEELYVSQPSGFIVDGEEHKVPHLNKTLYRLKQAPRAWNAKFDTTMVSLGFQRSISEHGVYIRTRGGSRLIVSIYVDDLVISGPDREEKKFRRSRLRCRMSSRCATLASSPTTWGLRSAKDPSGSL
jgi:hypothetical protein